MLLLNLQLQILIGGAYICSSAITHSSRVLGFEVDFDMHHFRTKNSFIMSGICFTLHYGFSRQCITTQFIVASRKDY
jgi:hypothetical protein